MTAEEFLRCWIEDKEDITLAQQHLRSVIRGELMNFRDQHNRSHFMTIDIDEFDEIIKHKFVDINNPQTTER